MSKHGTDLESLRTLLEDEDEITLLELLELKSEDILRAFGSKIKLRAGYISKYYANDYETEDTEGSGEKGWEEDPFDSYDQDNSY